MAKKPAAQTRNRRRARKIDPTANVIQLVKAGLKTQNALRAAESNRQSDLVKQEARHRQEIRKLEATARAARDKAEKSRIDALLLASKADVALALGKQEGQALAQDKRISTLEANQYSGAGRELGTEKAQQRTRFDTTTLVAVGGLALLAVEIYFHR